MKNQLITALLPILTLALYLSCGASDDGPDEPTAQELTFEQLAGQWSMPSTNGVIVDDIDRTLNYPGFRLSFADGTYTTTGAGTLFRSIGTWEWSSETTTSQLNLDDGKSITIQSLSATLLVFSFTKSGGGQRAGTEGNYTVRLTK